jgi:hypothetical protein
MTNHGLIRNAENEPVCRCGYRPEILDQFAPIGKEWKAKRVVLDHAQALNEHDALDPSDPFLVDNAVYPRAGVRQTPAGTWLLTLWDGMGIMHPIEEPEFKDRVTAFDYGWLTIGACRESGTNLNGWAA